MRVEFRPAGRFDQFITTYFAFAHAGKTNSRGSPTNLRQLAVTFRAYSDVIYGTTPPAAVQKVLFWVLRVPEILTQGFPEILAHRVPEILAGLS